MRNCLKFIAILIISSSLATAKTMDLPNAINTALANAYGNYHMSISNKIGSEIDYKLYKHSRSWKFSIDANRELNENAQINYNGDYENSYDYNSNTKLGSSIETDFLFGSTFSSGLGITLTRKKDMTNRKKYNLATSIETSITQPLFPEAIYYHSTKNKAYELNIQSYQLSSLKAYKKTILQTIKLYLQAYLSRKKLELELAELKTKQTLQTEVYNLFRYGKKTELDYDQIRIETLQNKSKLSSLKKQVKQTDQNLNKILGHNINHKIELVDPKIITKIITSKDISSIINNQKNIDIALINLQLLENRRNKAKIVADNSPSITAAGQQSWNNDSDTYKEILDNHNNRSYLYMFTFKIPIVNQDELQLNFRKNEIEQQRLLSNKHNKIQSYQASILDLYHAYLESKENITILKESIKLQKKNIRIQKVRYKSGNILLRDLISDQNQLKSSEIDLEEETANIYLTYLELMIELNGIDFCLENSFEKKIYKGAISHVSTR